MPGLAGEGNGMDADAESGVPSGADLAAREGAEAKRRRRGLRNWRELVAASRRRTCMDEEWIIRREIMDEASLFGDRENGAVEAWLASIEASWLEKYALQPEEVGKAVLLVAMEARVCLASRFAGLLEQGMDEALDKVDLAAMERRWGRTYADIAVDARKLAALRRYAKEYATDFAMGGSKVAVEILLRIRVSKDDEGTRRRVMGYVAETMHLPLALVAEVAGLPSMEPEPAEPAGGGWMAREEAMR